MSSSQWEVVTKSKKQKNLEKKVEANLEKKKIEALGPKLEEILPSHQYRNIIAGGKENHSPAKSTSSSTKSKSPKKSTKSNSNVTAKEQAPHKKQQQQQPPQSKQPQSAKMKSLESALRSMTADDFTAQLETIKLSFPGSELLWLKGVSNYFNTNLPFDSDPTFSGKSINYPSILATEPLKKAVSEFLYSVGEENLAYFYQTLLDIMTMELSKNIPVVGYKFILQLIGQHFPQICSNNMAKTALLRNSYVNRSNICLSILWAIGQGGLQKLVEGIRIWQNLMLPNLEMRSYTKFIVEYMYKILHSAVDRRLDLNQNEFFLTYNALKAKYPGIPRELQEMLARCAHEFLMKYVYYTNKHANIFLTLFRNIEDPNRNQTEQEGSVSCLIKGGSDSFKVWRMNYKRQLLPSILLLKAIDKEWPKNSSSTFVKELQEFLMEAQKLNIELETAKKRDPLLDDLIAVVTSVQEKTAQQKKKQNSEQKCKKCGCCKWTLGSIFLLALITGALCYDTEVNGKGVFANSATGKVLKNAGLLPYVEKAWYTTMSASARGYKWAEKHVPPYAKPAGKLACDLFKMGRNAACNACSSLCDLVSAKLPVVAKFLEQYVPGLPQKIEDFSVTVKNVSVDLFGKTVNFFKTQVLVGRFSPDNLSKALNETQNAALGYYYSFHKKVDLYAKLK